MIKHLTLAAAAACLLSALTSNARLASAGDASHLPPAPTVYRKTTQTFSFDLDCRVYRLTFVEHCTSLADGGEHCVPVSSRRDDFLVPCDQLGSYRAPRITREFI